MTRNDTPSPLLSLTVNGEPHRIEAGATIADLVAKIGLDPAKVAVEHNAEIAPRSTLADIVLRDGDSLEIVHFVGGG
ncbi:sulfur carrier protein ThiS [Novosphingobium profundi]|uniref:sulfur carrier protein ThiS n=1 Tax=Novosphingobium profundi TaxID=1774954 RepID=UPI001BD9F26C|nr:sulfur carrier protein ThiS [Novosphingobium profundi]